MEDGRQCKSSGDLMTSEMKDAIAWLLLCPITNFIFTGVENEQELNYGRFNDELEHAKPATVQYKVMEIGIYGLLLRLIYICSLFGEVMLMNVILQFLDGQLHISHGIISLTVIALVVIPCVGTLIKAHSDIMIRSSSSRYCGSLIGRVMRVQASDSECALSTLSSLHNLLDIAQVCIVLVTGPVQIFVSLVLLYGQIGTAVFVGVASGLLVLGPLSLGVSASTSRAWNGYLMKRSARLRIAQYMRCHAQEVRVNLLDIAVASVLRLSIAAEDCSLAAAAYMSSVVRVLVNYGLLVATGLLMLLTHIALDKTIDAATFFTSLGLLYMLLEPLAALPVCCWRVQQISSVLGALPGLEDPLQHRRTEALDLDEVPDGGVVDCNEKTELELSALAESSPLGASAGRLPCPPRAVNDAEKGTAETTPQCGCGDDTRHHRDTFVGTDGASIDLSVLLDSIAIGGLCKCLVAVSLGLIGRGFALTALFLIATWTMRSLDGRRDGDAYSETEHIEYWQVLLLLCVLSAVCDALARYVSTNHLLGFTSRLHHIALVSSGWQFSLSSSSVPVEGVSVAHIDDNMEHLIVQVGDLLSACLDICAAWFATIVATKGTLLVPYTFLAICGVFVTDVGIVRAYRLGVAQTIQERTMWINLRLSCPPLNTAASSGGLAHSVGPMPLLHEWLMSRSLVGLLQAWTILRVGVIHAGMVGIVCVVALGSGHFLTTGHIGVALLTLLILRNLLTGSSGRGIGVVASLHAWETLRRGHIGLDIDSVCAHGSCPYDAAQSSTGFHSVEANNLSVTTPSGDKQELTFTATNEGDFIIIQGVRMDSFTALLCGDDKCPIDTLYIGGVDVNLIPRDSLSRHVVILPERPVVFPTTVRCNIDPLARHTDQDIWRVLVALRLEGWVSSLPMKLEEQLVVDKGEDSMNEISLTHRLQLLSVARAVLLNASIMVFVAGNDAAYHSGLVASLSQFESRPVGIGLATGADVTTSDFAS